MNRYQFGFLLAMWLIVGAVIASFTERTDGGEFSVVDFLIVVVAWPLVLLEGLVR